MQHFLKYRLYISAALTRLARALAADPARRRPLCASCHSTRPAARQGGVRAAAPAQSGKMMLASKTCAASAVGCAPTTPRRPSRAGTAARAIPSASDGGASRGSSPSLRGSVLARVAAAESAAAQAEPPAVPFSVSAGVALPLGSTESVDGEFLNFATASRAARELTLCLYAYEVAGADAPAKRLRLLAEVRARAQGGAQVPFGRYPHMEHSHIPRERGGVCVCAWRGAREWRARPEKLALKRLPKDLGWHVIEAPCGALPTPRTHATTA